MAVDLQNLKWTHSPIKIVRTGAPIPATLRLVFDLKVPIRFKVSSQPKKIMLDIYEVQPSKVASTFKISKIPVLKPMIVVIDPGHGGRDPGAIGQYGTKEKNIVLAISQKLAKLINEQSNMRAILTRNGDYFVTLPTRLKLARKNKADIFVAVHADSFFNDNSTGASVYALSQHGTTSVAARWLSDRENHSELGGVDFRELKDQSLQLRSVLIDLAQTATINDSLRLGTTLLDALDEISKLHYPRVEQAPFLVLKSPDIPSVLVETGFLSNPQEEEKLRDPSYQNKVAKALFYGIQRYLKKYVAMNGSASRTSV